MLWIYCKRDPSVESFRAANALFYWWKSGVEREKKKSMILGATLQKCQKEVQTKKWLFLSYCQWLNMNSPFPSDPALADDLLVHDFHFISSHRHEDIKSTLCSILRWNHIVRDQGVRLQIFHTTGCVLCLPRPQDRSLSQLHFPLKATGLSPGCCQNRETLWSDACWPFLPLSPWREPSFPGAVFSFKSCRDQLIPSQLFFLVVSTYCKLKLVSKLPTELFQLSLDIQGGRVNFYLISSASSPSISYLPSLHLRNFALFPKWFYACAFVSPEESLFFYEN